MRYSFVPSVKVKSPRANAPPAPPAPPDCPPRAPEAVIRYVASSGTVQSWKPLVTPPSLLTFKKLVSSVHDGEYAALTCVRFGPSFPDTPALVNVKVEPKSYRKGSFTVPIVCHLFRIHPSY